MIERALIEHEPQLQEKFLHDMKAVFIKGMHFIENKIAEKKKWLQLNVRSAEVGERLQV